MNKLLRYLDLASKKRSTNPESYAETTGTLRVGVQYLAVVLGIIVQKYWSAYRLTSEWNFDGIWGWCLFALITAIAILPSVYKNSIDPTQPWLVQFGLIFTAGMGWQAIISNALPKT